MPIQSDPFYADGLQFSCTECSLCCRFDSGYVFLSRPDLTRLALRFSLTQREFVDRYCRIVAIGSVSRLTLREQENLDCIFWRDGGCSVYKDRPLQCRSFPFWPAFLESRERWERVRRECPGVDTGPVHSARTIESWLELRERTPLLDPKRDGNSPGEGA